MTEALVIIGIVTVLLAAVQIDYWISNWMAIRKPRKRP